VELRHELSGEPPPRGGLLASMADMGGLLRPLEGLRLSEEIARPIVHLLLTEALVGCGRAARVIRLRLGVPIGGRRKVENGIRPSVHERATGATINRGHSRPRIVNGEGGVVQTTSLRPISVARL
jgi:hypothetical protein